MTRKPFSERRRSYSTRPVGTITPKETFLIVCEGEKTEPNYFKSFRVPKDVIEVHGIGDNTLGVVNKAIELKSKGDYDQVWCVFDRDSFPPARFNAAFVLANENNIEIAYSNEAFELWYLLHFNYHDTGMSRSQYKAKLTKCLGYKYEKKSTTIYEEILERQPQAIKNAERLLATFNPKNPERDNPSTTVHLLVEELNKFIS
jgi:hypothetical protein